MNTEDIVGRPFILFTYSIEYKFYVEITLRKGKTRLASGGFPMDPLCIFTKNESALIIDHQLWSTI